MQSAASRRLLGFMPLLRRFKLAFRELDEYIKSKTVLTTIKAFRSLLAAEYA
jgi:hypothetical protein